MRVSQHIGSTGISRRGAESRFRRCDESRPFRVDDSYVQSSHAELI